MIGPVGHLNERLTEPINTVSSWQTLLTATATRKLTHSGHVYTHRLGVRRQKAYITSGYLQLGENEKIKLIWFILLLCKSIKFMQHCLHILAIFVCTIYKVKMIKKHAARKIKTVKSKHLNGKLNKLIRHNASSNRYNGLI